MIENIKVAVRVCPLTKTEHATGCKIVAQAYTKCGVLNILHPVKNYKFKSFDFDAVFDNMSTQSEVFKKVGLPMVENLLEGYNGTILAYGASGTGKTWTMEGNRDISEQVGIIPNVFDYIFYAMSQADSNVNYIVKLNYFEIYMEKVRDLLSNSKTTLEMCDHPSGGVFVEGLMEYFVSSLDEVYQLLDIAKRNRATSTTKINEFSSRSHAVITISVLKEKTNSKGEKHVLSGKLNLVDLAGSERQDKSENVGTRLKESIHINKSLTTLELVISELAEGKAKHVRYRDSKLTRLLQESLGGNSETTMIATISAADISYRETMCTLDYAVRTRNIKNEIIVNDLLCQTEPKLGDDKNGEQIPKMVKSEGTFIIDREKTSVEQTDMNMKWKDKLEIRLQTVRALNERLQAILGLDDDNQPIHSTPQIDPEKRCNFFEKVKSRRELILSYQAINDRNIRALGKLKRVLGERVVELSLIQETCHMNDSIEWFSFLRNLFENNSIPDNICHLMDIDLFAAIQKQISNENASMENLIGDYQDINFLQSTTIKKDPSSSCPKATDISNGREDMATYMCQLSNRDVSNDNSKELHLPRDAMFSTHPSYLEVHAEREQHSSYTNEMCCDSLIREEVNNISVSPNGNENSLRAESRLVKEETFVKEECELSWYSEINESNTSNPSLGDDVFHSNVRIKDYHPFKSDLYSEKLCGANFNGDNTNYFPRNINNMNDSTQVGDDNVIKIERVVRHQKKGITNTPMHLINFETPVREETTREGY